MINSSYKIVVERLRAFAEGHFYIKSFEHDTLDAIDLSTRIDYPIMQVIPGTITPSPKQLAYSFDIVFADIARRKTDLELNTEEVISDMTRIALDLVFEITNGQVLFGRGVTVSEGSTITSFIDGYENTITGVTLSITINVPDQWNACIIPADWATGGTGYPSEGMRIMSIPVLDEGNFVVNAYELDFRGAGVTVTREGNIARVTIPGSTGGLTCQTLSSCQVIIDINSAIETLEGALTSLASTVSNLSATVGGIQNDITAIEADVAALQTLTTSQGSAIDAIEAEQVTQNTAIQNNTNDITALDGRLDTAETNISNLESTQSSQGGAITSLDSRVTTAESDINAIEAEQVTQNNNITALQTNVTNLLSWIGKKFIDTTDSAAVTGTTTSTLVRSVFIPAGTVQVGQVLRFRARARKTTSGTCTLRVFVHTAASAGGIQIIQNAAANTNTMLQVKRDAVIKSATNTEVFNATASAVTDDVNSNSAVSTLNINWAVDQYVNYFLQNSVSGDTSILSFNSIMIDVENE